MEFYYQLYMKFNKLHNSFLCYMSRKRMCKETIIMTDNMSAFIQVHNLQDYRKRICGCTTNACNNLFVTVQQVSIENLMS